eukprot:gene60356-biopygen50216
MREVVLDTETTGLDPLAGNRVVEIGCIELVNLVATGRSLQLYLNPEMPMPAGAQEVHGLSDEFLADKPLFADKAEEHERFGRTSVGPMGYAVIVGRMKRPAQRQASRDDPLLYKGDPRCGHSQKSLAKRSPS